MNWLLHVLRWCAAVAVAVLVLPLVWQWAWDTISPIRHLPPYGIWFCGGTALALALVLWKKPNALLHTFLHEAAHFVVCLLLFVRVHSFQVSDGKGGYVLHEKVDPLRHLFICLAPYTLPMALGPVLVARYYAHNYDWRCWLTAAVGFLTVHHLHGLYHNVRLNFWGKQADLSKAGKPLSLVVIATALLALLPCVAVVLYS